MVLELLDNVVMAGAISCLSWGIVKLVSANRKRDAKKADSFTGK